MSDDLSNRGGGDRSRVSASEPHEVRYFAQKHGLTEDQVRELIRQHGDDRAALEQAIAQRQTTSPTG
jgi:Protein of unknown function (DUF3606)